MVLMIAHSSSEKCEIRSVSLLRRMKQLHLKMFSTLSIWWTRLMDGKKAGDDKYEQLRAAAVREAQSEQLKAALATQAMLEQQLKDSAATLQLLIEANAAVEDLKRKLKDVAAEEHKLMKKLKGKVKDVTS